MRRRSSCFSFCGSLLLNTISSSAIHVATNSSTSFFFFKNWFYFNCKYNYIIFLCLSSFQPISCPPTPSKFDFFLLLLLLHIYIYSHTVIYIHMYTYIHTIHMCINILHTKPTKFSVAHTVLGLTNWYWVTNQRFHPWRRVSIPLSIVTN